MSYYIIVQLQILLSYTGISAMQKLTKLAVVSFATLASSFASAASISGSTDFRVNIPEILVLYHWDDAYLTLNDVATTSANDSDPREISDATTRSATGVLGSSPYTITGDVSTATLATSPLNAPVDVTLQNSWAVRSISSAPVKLALTNPNTTLKNVTDAAATITTSSAVLQSAAVGATGTGTAAMTLPAGWTPVMGDIKFKLDLSNATKPGEYNTRGTAGAATTAQESTDTFLLTLTGNAP